MPDNTNLYTNPRTASHVRRVLASIKDHVTDIQGDYVSAGAVFGTDGVLIESDGTDRGVAATSILTVDVVTADTAFGTDDLVVVSDGVTKGVEASTIAAGDVVQATSSFGTDGVLIESDGTGKNVVATAIASADVVQASSAFSVDASLILSDGVNKNVQASSYIELNLDRWDNTILGVTQDYLMYESFVDVDSDTDLHDTAPYIASTSAAAVWTANDVFNKDGSMDGGNTGAFFPFSPQPGFRYYLELELATPVSGGTAGNGIIFGYGEDLPTDRTATGSANYFGADATTGKAVIYLSDDTGTQENALFLGDGTDGFANEESLINSSISLDTDLLNVRLILDTTAPDGIYTCEILAKRDQDSEWLDASNKKIALVAQDIGAIGIASNDASTTSSFNYFALWSERIDNELFAVEPIVGNLIYHEAFSGFAQADQEGTAPNIAPSGVVWQAHNSFQDDGTMGSNAGAGMYLPFAPESGRIYYLDVHIDDISNGADGFGIHMGFCEGISSTADDTGSDAYMGADPTTGKLTALLVTSAFTGSNRTYLGTASVGLSNAEEWSDATLKDDHGEKFVRLKLDTTLADGTYRGTCYSKLEDDEQWTQVSTVRPLAAQDIGAIGFASLGSTTTTQFFAATLWYEIPEQNTVTEETGAGTAYSLTDTSAAIDLGTTDPDIVIAEEGEYLLRGWAVVDYNGATYASADTVTLTTRRTNNTPADVDTVTLISPVMTTLDDSKYIAVETFYSTDNTDDAIALYANVGSTPSAGSVDISQCAIRAIKLI